MTLVQWLASDNTGLSSLYMASVLSGQFSRRYAYPLDPSDFQRCVLFTLSCPEYTKDIHKMAATGKEWAKIVEHWDNWVALLDEEYPTGTAPRLYAAMKEAGL